MPVGVAAAPTCSIAGAVAFNIGTYDPFDVTTRQVAQTLTMNCPPGQTNPVPRISVSPGTPAGGGEGYLVNATSGDRLRYAVSVGAITQSGARTFQAPIFLRVPASQDVTAGSYTDTIIVTIDL